MPERRTAENNQTRILAAATAERTSRASDEQHVVVLRREVIGSRDLHAAAVALAIHVSAAPGSAMVVLASRFPRMTRARILDEWRLLTAVLRPDVVAKLGLMAFATDGSLVQPDDPWLMQNLQTVAAELPIGRDAQRSEAQSVAWTSKTFSVWRTLLDAWLMAERSLQVAQLCERSGCSHPTVRAVVDSMKRNGEVRIERDRSVSLTALPRQSLDEVVVNLERLRHTRRYVDATGLPGNPERLLRRLLARHPTGVMVGGVAAARHYMPAFDLNGLPRLDVSLAPSSTLLVADLDPALAIAGPAASPVLVVHQTVAATQSAFSEPTYADASEVFLDLLELQLNEQAVDFAATLRRQQEAIRG